MSLGLSITQLWEDPGVQQIYGLSHQFQLNETAKYGNHEYFTTKYIAWPFSELPDKRSMLG